MWRGLAAEDPLTGLPNRRVFRSTLDQMTRLAHPFGQGCRQNKSEFAVLFLDLDRFKVVNDTLGHRIGDLLLQEVAKRLKLALRATDILARLGGDEFAIVVPSFVTRAALEVLANGLIVAVAQPYEIDGYRIRSSVSIGIAIGPQDGETVDDLLMAADLALYSVKAGNRGTYQVLRKVDEQGAQRSAADRSRSARGDRAQRAGTALSADHQSAAQCHHRASRRWHDGAIRSKAWCRRRCSSRSRKTAGSSCRSASGRCGKRAARRRNGRTTCRSRSTFRPCNSRRPTCSA